MVNKQKAEWLGFNNTEIKIADMLVSSGAVTPRTNYVMEKFNVAYEVAKRAIYLFNISEGRTNIGLSDYMEMSDVKKLAAHFRKMNNGRYQELTMYDLERSSMEEIPRYAVIQGIEDETFGKFNSKDLSASEVYKVDKITTGNVIIRTRKTVALKYRRDRNYELSNVIKIVGKDFEGNTVLKVNKDYCKLCNRFTVVASLRITDNHLGMYTLINKAGNIIYIYARSVEAGKTICKNSKEKIYAYGMYPSEIDGKLKEVAKKTYNTYGCMFYQKFQSNMEYSLFTSKIQDDYDDNEMVMF